MRIALLASQDTQGAPAQIRICTRYVLVLEAYRKSPHFPLLAKFGASPKDLRLVPNRQKPRGAFHRLTFD